LTRKREFSEEAQPPTVKAAAHTQLRDTIQLGEDGLGLRTASPTASSICGDRRPFDSLEGLFHNKLVKVETRGG
jgi:hypothetical protein